MNIQSDTIRELNDAFRQTLLGGKVVFAGALADIARQRNPLAAQAVVQAVRRYDRFTADNDPHGEHDFGSFKVGNDTLFWKIDYYDQSLERGSDDPADPKKTTRVLTIMFARDY